jgi:RNA polymerase sigma-70 factor (ECF subfamily)
VFGVGGLDLAERRPDAMLAALQQWPYHGVPTDPVGWLYRVARNRAVDRVRRTRWWQGHEDVLREALTPPPASPPAPRAGFDDDELAMVWMACHPALSDDLRVALALKTVGGLSAREIARVCLVSEAAAAQRVVRAKRAIAERGITLDTPAAAERDLRVSAVLETLYLLFTVGVTAPADDTLGDDARCGEAIRLASIAAHTPALDLPETHALLALMCFHAARLPSRITEPANWRCSGAGPRGDRALARGIRAPGALGTRATRYHSRRRCRRASAPAFEATDWQHLLALRPPARGAVAGRRAESLPWSPRGCRARARRSHARAAPRRVGHARLRAAAGDRSRLHGRWTKPPARRRATG